MAAPSIAIASFTAGDWVAVERIYAAGIASGVATFETAPPTWEAWDSGHLATPRLVARCEGDVVGWAALSPVSPRAAYRGVAEVSVYVAPSCRGRGVGLLLLRELEVGAIAAGLWTLQATIFAANTASLRLHQRAGFRTVGHRERIAARLGVWHDTVLMERRLAAVSD